MKKASKNNPIDPIEEILNNAISKGILHLNTENEVFDGRSIKVNRTDLINFGSCSYLGLETDNRIKNGIIETTLQYGSQFSSSRTYVSCGLYVELESLLNKVFGAYTLVGPSTSLTHIGAIPVIVDNNDAIIMDQQVHGTIQNAVQLVRSRGITTELIRHSNLEMLEDRIKKLRNTHYRIWYMIDGVYSMYGDYAPIREIFDLMDKYPQLHLYVDDAHGMSWAGKNGSGCLLSQVPLHPKMIFTTSLNKAFAGGGGVIVSLNKDIIQKIKTCGTTFVFSGPMQPPMLGASIASAKIHLSDEIYNLQEQLNSRVIHLNKLINDKKLPHIKNQGAPLFFFPFGKQTAAINMAKKLLQEGFYTDVAMFPAVGQMRSGIRIPITNHHTLQDIDNVINALEHYYPIVLKKEKQSIEELNKQFKIDFEYPNNMHLNNSSDKEKEIYKIEVYHSIHEIKKETWDSFFSDQGSYDWEGCAFLEKIFSNNSEIENNWEFLYYIVKNSNLEICAATFFTVTLCKDDMLADESVSNQIEKLRKSEPYYLTSKIIMMGSMLTEGNHLYINQEIKNWQRILNLLLEDIRIKQTYYKANAIYIRDIEVENHELRDFFIEQGFIRFDLPESHNINGSIISNSKLYFENLSPKSRIYQRKHVLPFEQYFNVEYITNNKVTDQQVRYWHKLYRKVKNKKLNLNTFELPSKIFYEVVKNPNWIIFELTLKKEYQKQATSLPIAVCFIYKSKNTISPIFLGIDYDFLMQFSPYRQTLLQIIKTGIKLNVDNIYLGMGADFEKRRFGATGSKRCLFIQSNESFNMEIINSFQI